MLHHNARTNSRPAAGDGDRGGQEGIDSLPVAWMVGAELLASLFWPCLVVELAKCSCCFECWSKCGTNKVAPRGLVKPLLNCPEVGSVEGFFSRI